MLYEIILNDFVNNILQNLETHNKENNFQISFLIQ